jgi:hypothetical protein
VREWKGQAIEREQRGKNTDGLINSAHDGEEVKAVDLFNVQG